MVYQILETVFGYVIPIAVIAFCYLSINRVARQNQRAQPQDAGLPQHRDDTRQSRLFALNTSVTIAYLIGHGIFHAGYMAIMIAWYTLEPGHTFFPIFDNLLERAINISFYANAALNPVFYIATNRRLRKHVWDAVRSYRTAEATAAHQLGESTSTVTSLPVEPVSLKPFQQGPATVEDAKTDCQDVVNE